MFTVWLTALHYSFREEIFFPLFSLFLIYFILFWGEGCKAQSEYKGAAKRMEFQLPNVKDTRDKQNVLKKNVNTRFVPSTGLFPGWPCPVTLADGLRKAQTFALFSSPVLDTILEGRERGSYGLAFLCWGAVIIQTSTIKTADSYSGSVESSGAGLHLASSQDKCLERDGNTGSGPSSTPILDGAEANVSQEWQSQIHIRTVGGEGTQPLKCRFLGQWEALVGVGAHY